MKRSLIAVAVGYLTYALMKAAVGFLRIFAGFPASGEVLAAVLVVIFWAADLGCAAMAGYVTARMARKAELQHAAVLAFLIVLGQFYNLWPYLKAEPFVWSVHLRLAATALAACAGGYLFTARRPAGDRVQNIDSGPDQNL